MHGGDLLTAAALLLSGSNFQKIQMFSKFLKLPIVSRNTFFKIQRTYLIPTVDHFWTEHQDSILDQFRDQDLVILGMYCTHNGLFMHRHISGRGI